ncbi:transposase [Verticillium dahliae]
MGLTSCDPRADKAYRSQVGAHTTAAFAINAWFRDVRDTIAKYGVADTDIYNFDETGFQMGVIHSGIVVASSEKRSSVKKKQPGNREWVTVIQGVGANGFCVPPFVVFSGKYHLSKWLKHFGQHTKGRTSAGYRILILDGHESHVSEPFRQYTLANKILTLRMPPHSSHLLQPLNVGCFGPLKKAYGRQIENKMRAGTSHIRRFSRGWNYAFQSRSSSLEAGCELKDADASVIAWRAGTLDNSDPNNHQRGLFTV